MYTNYCFPGLETVTWHGQVDEEKTPKRKSLSRSKSQGKTTPSTHSITKQPSGSVLINMTSNQSRITDSASEMDIDTSSVCGTIVSSKTGSEEKTVKRSLVEMVLKRSPIQTRRRSLSRNRKPDTLSEDNDVNPVQTRRRSLSRSRKSVKHDEVNDVKPSLEELSSSVVSAEVVELKQQEVERKRSDTNSEIQNHTNSKVNINTSKQISSSKPGTAPKGLRPTIKHSSHSVSKTGTKMAIKPGSSSAPDGIPVHCDTVEDEKSKVNESLKRISKTNLSNNISASQTGRQGSSLQLKSGNLSSGSKLLQDMDQSSQLQTRSQSKLLDNSQVKVCT